MRRLAGAALLVAVLLGGAKTVEAQDGGAIIGRAARVYRGLSSLRADFTQVIDDKMIGTFESKGSLVQTGQSKFAMRFTDPNGEAIVMDGRYLWVYTPSTTPGQVLRSAIPSGPVYGFNVIAWLLDRPAERYDVAFLRADSVDGRAMDVVQLTPNVPDLPFNRAVLWLDRGDALPRRIEIEERSTARRTLTLSKLRVNESVSDKTFAFDVPSGVRIIDQE